MKTMDINFSQPSPAKNLTQREIEVLKWSAEGKTAGDIAMILCLKERTIHFHIASAIQKWAFATRRLPPYKPHSAGCSDKRAITA